MGERGQVLVPREPGRPGWAATRVLEQVRERMRRLEQEPVRVLREQGHLVLAVLRESVRVPWQAQELEHWKWEQARDLLEQEPRHLRVESLERKATW